jgi:glutamate racemase
MAFLSSFDIKAIVVACGTVSTAAFSEIEGRYEAPLIAVVAPAVQKAVESTKNKRIGLIGTVASINSRAFEKMILEKLPDAEIFSAACPLLVPLVENGRINRGDIMIETAISEYLAPIKAKGVDTLILGCTHYPLLHEVIAAYMGEGVSLISPGAETAFYVEKILKANGLSAEADRKAQYHYYVTDSVEGFSNAASLFLNTDVRGEVSKVDLSIYED